jgi:hypothetical protein
MEQKVSPLMGLWPDAFQALKLVTCEAARHGGIFQYHAALCAQGSIFHG